MAFRALYSLPSLLSSAACTVWLQRVAGSATASSADSVRRGLSAARAEEQPARLQTEGLPPPWEPPLHNPRSLTPKPAPTLSEILSRIQQAPTVVDVHNAYRRKSKCLPPPVAAAMFKRLAQILETTPGGPGAAAATQPQQLNVPGATTTGWRQRGQRALLAEIRKSWDVFLHLTSAQNLAALVRASCETGLLQQVRRGTPAEAASDEDATWSCRDTAIGVTTTSIGGADCDLVQRSLDVLLDSNGRELAEAGPQAILDVSYGLMLTGHDEVHSWHILGPLLRNAQLQLQGSADGTADLAGKVLAWLKEKGLPA